MCLQCMCADYGKKAKPYICFAVVSLLKQRNLLKEPKNATQHNTKKAINITLIKIVLYKLAFVCYLILQYEIKQHCTFFFLIPCITCVIQYRICIASISFCFTFSKNINHLYCITLVGRSLNAANNRFENVFHSKFRYHAHYIQYRLG